jgi:hypothetical protein
VTKYFEQGRDLDKPLVEIPHDARWPQRIALKAYSLYLWLTLGFVVFAFAALGFAVIISVLLARFF